MVRTGWPLRVAQRGHIHGFCHECQVTQGVKPGTGVLVALD